MTTILLIEDNDDIRENTAEILEFANYKVYTAANGRIGVEKALEIIPDMVICDIMMPVLDGFGVLQIFNKNPALQGIPFIFLTAKTDRADFRRGMEMGADDYLTKPFGESELLSAIEGRLKRFTQRHETPPRPEHDPAKDGLARFLEEISQATGVESLATERKVHTIRKKQYIYSEGEVATRLYFLKTGKVKTFKTSTDGKELITGLYQPGEFFGYTSLLEHTNQTETAVTIEDSEMIYIPKDDFLRLIGIDQDVTTRFVRLLANRVREREEQLLGMAYHSLRKRVATMLVQLYEQQDGKTIHYSRDDLASMVGTATESVIRILSEFKSDGLVEITGTEIRVLQPDKLRQSRW